MPSRRGLIGGAGATAIAAALGRRYWPASWAGVALDAGGPYGDLAGPDAEGINLPAGFRARVVARTGVPVGATGFTWHAAPDGGACFAAGDGGWIYVSNSEVGGGAGGASAIRFAPDGAIVDAYSILSGTSVNCAGGATSWGTWLSCEETATGQVYECDPSGAMPGVVRPALGTFPHEAAAEDPTTGAIYLTEDNALGRLYRFVPRVRGNVAAGTLSAAAVSGGTVGWVTVADTAPARGVDTTAFNGGEGIYVDGRGLYFATKGDRRVWRLGLDTNALDVLYELPVQPSGGSVDNIAVHLPSGDVFVAQDVGDVQLHVLVPTARGTVARPFLRFEGHAGSELTGPAFSPDGSRLYLSSQRGNDGRTGWTIEVIGPFRTLRAPGVAHTSGLVEADRLGTVE